jgi:hypothetical protein
MAARWIDVQWGDVHLKGRMVRANDELPGAARYYRHSDRSTTTGSIGVARRAGT